MENRRRKIIGFVTLIGILAIVPWILDNPYYIHLLIMVGMNAMLAMSFILMLRTGLISLGIAAFWGVGAYASALLSMKLGVSFWIALPVSTIITGIVAFGIGCVLVKNPGFGFLIETVVLGEIAVLAFGHIPLFGGFQGIVSIPPVDPIPLLLFSPIEFSSKTSYYYLVVFLVFLVAVALSAFYAAWSGRAWIAIGLNPRLGESLGVNLFRYRLLSFVVASAVAGLAGSFYAHYYGAIAPTTFNVFKTIYIHIFAILGGITFPILGPITGAFIMTVVPELLRIAKEVEPIFTGLLLILLMLFLPHGLLSLFMPGRRTMILGDGFARVSRWVKNVLLSTRSE